MLAPPTAASTAPPSAAPAERAGRDELRGREPEELPRLLGEQVLPADRAFALGLLLEARLPVAVQRLDPAARVRLARAECIVEAPPSRSRCLDRCLVLDGELGAGDRVDEQLGDDRGRLAAAAPALRHERAHRLVDTGAPVGPELAKDVQEVRASNETENASKSRTIPKY